MVENHECRAGLGRPIGTVIASIPVPGHCGQDSKSCTKIGEATLPNRERNRPEDGERQNDPIQVRCTPMDRCSKNAQIVRRNPAVWRARNAFQTAKDEPHIISLQGYTIRLVYIRLTSKTWPDYPPALVGRLRPDVHLSGSSFILPPSSFRTRHRPPKCVCTASPLFSSQPTKSVSSRSSAQNLRFRRSRT